MDKNTLEDSVAEDLFVIPPKPKDDSLNWWKLILFFTVYYGITFFVGGLVGVFIGVWSELSGQDADTLINEALNHPLITYLDYIGFVVVLLIFKSIRQFLKGILSWKAMVAYRTYLLIISGFIAIYTSQYLFIDVLKWELISNQIEDTPIYYNSISAYLLVFISIAMITPIQEEIMFRGVLQKFLGEKWRIWIGIIVTSIIFGLLHPGYILSGMAMGFVFGSVYHLTRSLWPAIILHALWNGYIIVADILF